MFKKIEALQIAAVSCVLLFFVLIPNTFSQAATIHSVSSGGNWNDTSTWVENTVPGSLDIVEINGTVILNTAAATVSGLFVSSGAVLENVAGYDNTLTVNGDVVNNGTVQDSLPGNGMLAMSLTGNVTNNGTWNTWLTNLYSNQSRTIDGTSAINSNIALFDNFAFLNSPTFLGNFNFNGHTLYIASPNIITFNNTSNSGYITGGGDISITGYSSSSLDASGCIVYFRGNFAGTATSSNAIFENGASFGTNSIINSPVTLESTSTIQVRGNSTVNGSLLISSGAVLENNAGYNSNLTVSGSIVNNGTIHDSPSGNGMLVMATNGDITNNGIWNNWWTDFHSNQSRTIDGTNGISSSITLYDDFTILNSPTFSGNFNFNWHTLRIANPNAITFTNTSSSGSISGGADVILNGYSSGSIDASSSILYFKGNFAAVATSTNAIFEDGSSFGTNSIINSPVTLESTSTVQVRGNSMINGPLQISSGAVLENNAGYNSVLTINGNVANNGAVHDSPSGNGILSIYTTGNIANNGTWNNWSTGVAWPSVFGATNYLFDVTDNLSNWPEANGTGNTSYGISNLINSSHYWRVRADLGNGMYSPWSEIKAVNASLFGGFTFGEPNVQSGRVLMATAPFNLRISALDINGNPYGYNGSVDLSASNDATTTPSSITMSNGYWSGTTTIAEFGNSIHLTALAGNVSGVSSNFTINKKPVIIVPGLTATKLVKNIFPYFSAWPNVFLMGSSPGDDYLEELELNNDGLPYVNSPVILGDVIREITVPFYGTSHFYDYLITLLEGNGYSENENLFVFPYDWRLDISHIADNDFREKIESVKNQTGAQQVDVVVHSMGGLIAKKYIYDYSSTSIDKFIDIATPHLGSVESFQALTFGDDLGKGEWINPAAIKNISQNFPSMYQLLPSRAYFDASSTDYSSYISDTNDYDDNSVIGDLNYDQSLSFMANTGRNYNLLGTNDELHNDIDNINLSNYGIRAYNIVGCGQGTIGEISNMWVDDGSDQADVKYINGDGTVPLESALALNNPIITYYATGTSHALLPSFNGVKELVNSILDATSSVQFDFNSHSNISTSNNICGFSGYTISLHSPITLNAYDEQGRHVGRNAKGGIEINIPGAAYDEIGTNKYIFLPKGQNYRITGQATGVGHFNARVRTIDNGKITKYSYYDRIPIVSTSTSMELNFANKEPSDEIRIDQLGKKEYKDKFKPNSILKGRQLLIKPNIKTDIIISKKESDAEPTVITLKPTSVNGLSVLRTEYSLDDGKTWTTYTRGITLGQSRGYNIKYRSLDVAGNIERMEEKLIEIK